MQPATNQQPFFRVASATVPNHLAGAIAKTMREQPSQPVILQAVGPAAVNQAAKAIAIARTFLIQMQEIPFSTYIEFHKFQSTAEEERHALRFYLTRDAA